MKDLDLYSFIAVIVLLVGGINLGIYGLIRVDILSAILGELVGRLLFIGIGGAAGYVGYQIYLQRFKKV